MTEAVTRHSDLLGHDVRADPWLGQGRSSYALAGEALREHRIGDAVALARMTAQEAQEAYDLYALWLVQLPELLGTSGVPEVDLSLARVTAQAVADALHRGWQEYRSLVDRAIAAASVRPGDAGRLLERARSTWLTVHDPATDQIAGLLALGSRHLGEQSVGALWDALLGHYYDAIADRYDLTVHPWSRSVERLALDIFEAVRGHLTGPDRDGSFAVREEPDRWVLEFAPCGSGGRTYREAGATGRDERDFTNGEHDWAWRTRGVCLYCVHCCQLQQRAPIERIGIPLRVIEPPVRASAEGTGRERCRWSIYKDPALIPAQAWSDVGATPPPGAPGQPEPDADERRP
ncbi:hypothetical protein CFH99_23060 [Nocardioides aromaticivorans]|uniref:Uncharacterized protein n=1 Tax=Nocardioides aromaticivorans TaxID=200618 RepID=A0ABX7PRS1_9ACTN|nr:hypothetical protein [Nocardioides aromaticivorans]QSR28509.1 hypothetical protein CFH99_23060 [Nocardioides aromaticivorans]